MFPSKATLVSCLILQLSRLLDHGGKEGNPRSTSRPDTYCFQKDLIVGANSFSDGELLLDGHTASILASLIIQFTWAWRVPRDSQLKQSTSVCARHASFHDGPKMLGTVSRMSTPLGTGNVITIVASPHKNQKVPEGSAPVLTFGTACFRRRRKKKIPSLPTNTRGEQWGHCHLPGSWDQFEIDWLNKLTDQVLLCN